jgi:K+ transporter
VRILAMVQAAPLSRLTVTCACGDPSGFASLQPANSLVDAAPEGPVEEVLEHYAVTLRFGFAEAPDVPAALRLHRDAVGLDPEQTSFFLGREVPVPSLRPELKAWQEPLFVFLTRNAVRAPDYFRIPPPRVVELGTRVEL